MPTIGSGYNYALAVASALGIDWSSTHARSITLTLRGRYAQGSVDVADGWSDCRLARVAIQRRRAGGWHTFASAQSNLDGQFSSSLPSRQGIYRALVAVRTSYGQTCGQAVSNARGRP